MEAAGSATPISSRPDVPDLRRAAVEELKRRGIGYVLLFESDELAKAVREGRRSGGYGGGWAIRRSEAVSTAMKYFLGVDGGQSGTTAMIGDETGRVLGTGEAGPCNHAGAQEGRAKLERAVTASVAAACAAAKLDAGTHRFEAACFGMSGGPDDKREILAGILRADRLIVTTDAEIALAGATESGQGIIVIAGTGSIAYGRNAEGRARAPADGVTCSATRAAHSISCARPCGRRCGWKKAGARQRRCVARDRGDSARRMRMAPCTGCIRRNGRDRAPPRWRRWWMKRRENGDAVAMRDYQQCGAQLGDAGGFGAGTAVGRGVGGGCGVHRRRV